MFKLGKKGSSNKYKICSEGTAINSKITAGIIVQINSIKCSCNKFKLINLLINKLTIKDPTKTKIKVKIDILLS